MARFHTATAAETLFALGLLVPEADQELWTTAIENAGLLPDGQTQSVHRPAFQGFIVERNRSPHFMGGFVTGTVPSCPQCSMPAARVLTLQSASLPYDFRSDPSFYWFACDHSTLSYINVQIRADGLKVLLGSESSQGSATTLIPGERSLLLINHPNQTGISVDISAGFGRHQVGGFPPSIRMESFPVCLLCQKPMLFLAAIDSGMTPFGRLNFEGILYGFWCNDCATSTTYNQRG
jgi:hypothetical protein